MKPGAPGAVYPESTQPIMNHRLPALCALSLLLAGCLNVKTAPIEVKPIHVTVDINVKVDRALDDFFGNLDRKSTTIETKP